MFKLFKNRKSLMQRFAKVDVDQIQDEALKAKFSKLKGKQKGFTLLELLVVVSILAAIAGTATLALQDTDARAAAAAHVAMMDELNKGIRTYRVLNKTFPNNFDSLIMTQDASAAIDTAANVGLAGNVSPTTGAQVFNSLTWEDTSGSTWENPLLAIEDIEMAQITSTFAPGLIGALSDIGMNSVRVIDINATPEDSGVRNCTDLTDLIASRTNSVVGNNIFVGEDGGCGVDHTLAEDDFMTFWTGGEERVTGTVAPNATAYNADGNKALLALGVGPGSSLFDTSILGGMTTVPSYRHVSKEQYGRFISIWQVGTYDGSSNIVVDAQPQLITIVDGAGDTKEEELGEWDGSRNTI